MRYINRAAVWAGAVLVAMGLGGMPGAAAKDFYFTSGIRVADGGVNYDEQAVDIGDANNDGRDDLLLILGDPTPVYPPAPPGSLLRRAYVRLQTGQATLAPAIVLSVPMQNLNSIEAADLDDDGKNELVVGWDGGIIVYRWNGAEFLPTAVPGSYDCWKAVIGDLDGNGTRDIVCSARFAKALSLYHVASDGSVAETRTMPAAASPLLQFKLEDVTGDGRADLIHSDEGLWSFMLYTNDGSGGFFPARAYPWPADIDSVVPGTGIETFDADGDGVLEIFAARRCSGPCGNILVYKRDSAGHFRFWRYLNGYNSVATLEKYDVDGDGYLDLVGGHSAYAAISWFPGLPNGISRTYVLQRAVHASGYPFLIDLGDLNGDSRTDVAMTNFGVQAELIYGIGKRSADVDGDFNSDLVWRDAASGRNVVWRYGRSGSQWPLPVLASPWTIQGVADFNGDDSADLLWRNPNNGANMIWLGADATKTQDVAPQAPDWHVVGTGDFDGDLSDDVLWRHATTGANRIWPGADMAQAIDINTEADLGWKVAGVGDFDGDRVGDVLWRHATTGLNRVWFSANAATQVDLAPVPNLAWKVVGVADFNRDGMDDVVWRNVANGAQSLWRSADATRQQSVAAVANQAWQIVAVGDYYGDGKADLMWRHAGSGSMLLWNDANVATQETAGVGGTSWKVMP